MRINRTTSCARTITSTTLALVAASLATVGSATMSAGPAAGAVTIDAPEAPQAGVVELRGTVGAEPGETTTVLYALDASRSTSLQTGMDCSGNGAVGVEDDLNTDGSTGDVLDCEIAGVTALDRSLASTAGVQAGLVAFANNAAAADLDPVGTASFVPPGYAGGEQRSRIESVASSVVRSSIGLYEPRDLGGSGAGTAFNNAVSVSLDTLATAPAGPKWIMFLSDGQAAVNDAVLDRLASSGVKIRTFGVGPGATCAPTGSLYKMAAATGESCQLVPDPAALTAGLTGSRPDAVNGVTVTVDDVSVAGTLDAVGGWRASFRLGAGTYTANVTAHLASGAVSSARRTFTVAAAPDTPGAPSAGTVAPGPGALKATVVAVSRPAPVRDVLPSRVKGRVGSPTDGLTPVPALSGAVVLLQARATSGAPWTTVDRGRARTDGGFVLKWRPKVGFSVLRVVLEPRGEHAGSAAAVPPAPISACTVQRRRTGSRWTVTCRTTSSTGSVARLVRDGQTIDKSRVRRGRVRLDGTGSVGAHTIDIAVSRKRHIRLPL